VGPLPIRCAPRLRKELNALARMARLVASPLRPLGGLHGEAELAGLRIQRRRLARYARRMQQRVAARVTHQHPPASNAALPMLSRRAQRCVQCGSGRLIAAHVPCGESIGSTQPSAERSGTRRVRCKRASRTHNVQDTKRAAAQRGVGRVAGWLVCSRRRLKQGRGGSGLRSAMLENAARLGRTECWR
jgi:hypothetical protein